MILGCLLLFVCFGYDCYCLRVLLDCCCLLDYGGFGDFIDWSFDVVWELVVVMFVLVLVLGLVFVRLLRWGICVGVYFLVVV